MDKARLLVIIPAYNEADSIAGVIDDIRANTDADIVVVNDGSIDGTAKITLEKGAELLNMPFNLGIGSTMQTGFKFAFNQGYDIAVQVDGDGQHDAAEVAQLIQPLLDGDSDMVLGSRYLEKNGYSGTAGRRLGTAIFSRILSLMLRQKLTDATSGFRAINASIIKQFAHEYPRDYPEVEALLQVHMSRFRIKEIPVKMRERDGGQSSINAFRSIYYMVKVLLALLVLMSRKRDPRVESAK
jgi:hypothetical protein